MAEPDRLTAMTDEWLLKKQLATAAHEDADAAGQALIEFMLSNGQAASSGYHGRATLIQPVKLVYSEPKLKKALGAKLWAKITSESLDKKLLEANIATGDIDPNIVAECAEEVAVKPHLRGTFTRGSKVPTAAAPPVAVRSDGTKRRPQRRGQ